MELKIGEQIAALRKKNDLTQEELANLLGISNQAVSKWELNKCCPDIYLLPEIADVFKCSIDTLFGKEKVFTEGGNTYEHCSELPWKDDDVIRGVVCLGRKILNVEDGIVDKFTFEFKGDAKNLKSHCNLSVDGNVSGGCTAGKDFYIGGDCYSNCTGRGNITVNGNVTGMVTTCGDVNCQGDINGNITCHNVTANGNVTADRITGNVSCNELDCKKIVGTLNGNFNI